MNREQRYRQILDALFEIAEPGPTKVSLWQAYQEANKEPDQEDWQAIAAQAAADLEAVQTDKDAYAFIEKYFSRDLRGRYIAIYRSDRHEMNRSPRQAIDSLLSLPPLE